MMMITTQRLALERTIVKHLIEIMAAHGWNIERISDNGNDTHAIGFGAQLDAIFAADESQVIFENNQGRQHWVAIALGEGADVISDYSTALHHADNFGDVMADQVMPFIESVEAKA